MNTEIERELKVLLTKEQYDQIARTLPFEPARIQINTYYDTSDRKLKKQQQAVRVRQVNGTNILTIKKPKDAITKEEYEYEIPKSDLTRADKSIQAWMMEHGVNLEGLEPFVTTITKRRILNTLEAEISLDETIYGGKTDYEIEYEYRSDHDGISCFDQILAPFHIRYEKNCPSKLARALMHQDNENL